MKNITCKNPTSLLFRKPFEKLPQKIVYKKHFVNEQGIKMLRYNMYDIAQKKYAGYMLARPTGESYSSCFYPLGNYNSFKIEDLKAKEKRRGYGTDFINIAKKESRRHNCNGRVHLEATVFFDHDNPSHVFYRKKGFTSMFCEPIEYIDNCIKNRQKANHQKLCDLPMYLPLRKKTSKSPQQKSFAPACISYFKNLINRIISVKPNK